MSTNIHRYTYCIIATINYSERCYEIDDPTPNQLKQFNEFRRRIESNEGDDISGREFENFTDQLGVNGIDETQGQQVEQSAEDATGIWHNTEEERIQELIDNAPDLDTSKGSYPLSKETFSELEREVFNRAEQDFAIARDELLGSLDDDYLNLSDEQIESFLVDNGVVNVRVARELVGVSGRSSKVRK